MTSSPSFISWPFSCFVNTKDLNKKYRTCVCKNKSFLVMKIFPRILDVPVHRRKYKVNRKTCLIKFFYFSYNANLNTRGRNRIVKTISSSVTWHRSKRIHISSDKKKLISGLNSSVLPLNILYKKKKGKKRNRSTYKKPWWKFKKFFIIILLFISFKIIALTRWEVENIT